MACKESGAKAEPPDKGVREEKGRKVNGEGFGAACRKAQGAGLGMFEDIICWMGLQVCC